jgi:hypothetical protein
VLSHPVGIAREFKVFPIGRFSKEEREMISTKYQFEAAGTEDRKAQAAFRRVMRRYWGFL